MHTLRSLLPLVLVAAACTGTPERTPFDDLVGAPGVVTLTNLHPDEQRGRLFAVNYQQDGLIPVCSAVTLLERNAKLLRFRVEATGKTYEYYHHEKGAGEPFPSNLSRYFGASCPQAGLDALSARDKQGVEQGKALPGMTKAGVVFALGYPPPHATPSLDGDRWIYWTNRFNRKAVVFEGGRVSWIED